MSSEAQENVYCINRNVVSRNIPRDTCMECHVIVVYQSPAEARSARDWVGDGVA